MPRKIIAILTTSTPKPMYVESVSKRDDVIDNNLVVTMTNKPEEARNFESVTEAKAIIKRIHNPYDRVYVAKAIMVELSRQQMQETSIR